MSDVGFSASFDRVYIALERGDASALTNNSGTVVVDVNASNVVYGETRLLHAAVRSGQCDVVRRVLALGAAVNAVETWFGYTALHEAAIVGRRDLVELLLAAGADANARTPAGYAPLDIAADHDHAAVVALLSPLTRKPKKAARRRAAA